MNKKLNILICPLEWGLGHAARMIPVARELKDSGHRVIIGSGKKHAALFRSEIKDLEYINFSGFSPSYSSFLPQYLVLLFNIPVLIFHIIRENFRLRKIVDDSNIDIVISDNRFGLWNKKIRSVYVTHMPRIPFPRLFRFLEPVGIAVHRFIIRKYDLCFIPDLPGEPNLTGRLSHGVKTGKNMRYIGILSRFSPTGKISGETVSKSGTTVILSGPEPQRSILKNKLYSLLEMTDDQAVFLEGNPEKVNLESKRGKITFMSHPEGDEMKRILMNSNRIICRPGYTTLMELVSLGKNAIVIPTPGQTEQEYLAQYLSQMKWFTNLKQNKAVSLLPDGNMVAPPSELINEKSRKLLNSALQEMLEINHKY